MRMVVTVVVLSVVAVCVAAGPARAEQPPARQTCLRLADEIEKHFHEEVLRPWFPRCVDRAHGGFLPHFRHDWSRPTEPQPGPDDKAIVFQGRMTWVCAQVARRYPDLAEEYAKYTRHGLQCLDKTMWDAERGGFFWSLGPEGKIADRVGTEKHVYGISFGIYGAAAAYETTKDARALDLAKRAFNWLEEHAHDRTHGGYYEALTRSGEPILRSPHKDPEAASPRTHDLIGTLYGYKSMNTHIHLLEALSELYRVWPDPLVERRLREVFLLVRDRVAVEPGCLNLFFTPDWRPVPDHDSFGHDVETGFLLLEAAEVLHEAEDAKTLRVARGLVDHGLDWGWDTEHGGFYDRGAAFHKAWGREKVWWTQAEGLNALLTIHERFGRDDPRYLAAFRRQWDFIREHQTDREHGGWHAVVDPEGKPHKGDKGSNWKTAYHNGRALMNAARTLRRLGR